MLEINKTYLGDCLEIMKSIDDHSVDCIICDLPYGITQCKWDVVIPMDLLWLEYKRIIKNGGAICLFGTEPFSSMLRTSNLKDFKYDWIWLKNRQGGFQVARFRPMQKHEIISVFCYKTHNYYPIMTPSDKIRKRCYKKSSFMSKQYCGQKYANYNSKEYISIRDTYYPTSILNFNIERNKSNPTAKPVLLYEYLIKTYSLENQLILDNCAGSGTLGVACKNTNRNFIMIEKDEVQYENILKRLGI